MVKKLLSAEELKTRFGPYATQLSDGTVLFPTRESTGGPKQINLHDSGVVDPASPHCAKRYDIPARDGKMSQSRARKALMDLVGAEEYTLMEAAFREYVLPNQHPNLQKHNHIRAVITLLKSKKYEGRENQVWLLYFALTRKGDRLKGTVASLVCKENGLLLLGWSGRKDNANSDPLPAVVDAIPLDDNESDEEPEVGEKGNLVEEQEDKEEQEENRGMGGFYGAPLPVPPQSGSFSPVSSPRTPFNPSSPIRPTETLKLPPGAQEITGVGVLEAAARKVGILEEQEERMPVSPPYGSRAPSPPVNQEGDSSSSEEEDDDDEEPDPFDHEAILRFQGVLPPKPKQPKRKAVETSDEEGDKEEEQEPVEQVSKKPRRSARLSRK